MELESNINFDRKDENKESFIMEKMFFGEMLFKIHSSSYQSISNFPVSVSELEPIRGSANS